MPTTSTAIAEEGEEEGEVDRPVQKALAATEVRKEGEVGGLMGEMGLRDLRDLRRLQIRWLPRSPKLWAKAAKPEEAKAAKAAGAAEAAEAKAAKAATSQEEGILVLQGARANKTPLQTQADLRLLPLEQARSPWRAIR